MHELSIIHSIIETVEATVAEQDAPVEVERVLLQVGDLAGVEIENLEFLWPAAVQDTVLQQAICVIERVKAHAVCLDCNTEFSLKNYFDACPACGSFWKDVTAGEELKIKSIELCVQPADAVATATN